MTFNYDLLLDAALARVPGVAVGELGLVSIAPRFWYFKLHGSVNWGRPVFPLALPMARGTTSS